jgi:cellulose synthase/poly-beta-1,6-N-acetylglucosamine synthase-like glycosyltransferase
MGGIDEKMKISIIICAYNEESGIGRLLKNLAKQRQPPEITDHEIIVVASGCTDRTVPIVKECMAENSKITLIEEKKRRGKAAAMNKAFKVASGEVIVSIPADVQPAEDGLYHLLLPFQDPNVSAVSGNPTQHPKSIKNGFLAKIANITYAFWVKEMSTLNDAGLAAHSTGEFMAMRADITEHIPEECAAEDSYISVLARRKGHIKFASKAIAYNVMPSNILDYINQRKRWLFGHFQTHRLTGEYPTVMDTLIFHRTKLAMSIFKEVFLEDPKRLPFFFVTAFIEAGIFALAVSDTIMRRRYAVWPIIKSTKVKIDD